MNHEVEVPRVVREAFGPEVARDMLRRISNGERVGQAFMNALPDSMYLKLTFTTVDPFYKDTYAAVWEALEFLTQPS